MEVSKKLQNIKRDDLLVSYECNSLYFCVQIALNSTWRKIETAYPFEKYTGDSVCSLFNSGGWSELNGCLFLTVKYNSPENLFFQHLPVREENSNPNIKKRLEESNRMRKIIIIDTLTIVYNVDIVHCGGISLEISEGFFCHNLEYNPYSEFVDDMFDKRDFF